MGSDDKPLSGPDLERGIAWSELREGTPFVGHAQGEAVLLVRHGEQVFATGATCTHYSGPLGEGLIEGESVRSLGITRASACAPAKPSARPR